MEKKIERLNKTAQEIEGWKKTLLFLQHENILQKNRLAILLKDAAGENEHALEIAEQYQNQFLQQDETFRLMLNDILCLEKTVRYDQLVTDRESTQIDHDRRKLKKEMDRLQVNFAELKTCFLGELNASQTI